MHRKLTPKAARSKMMYEHPVLFAERKEVREARARDLQNALKKTAATEAERNPFGRRSTAASAAWGAVLDAADVGTDPRARRGENAMIWRATQLLAGSRPDSEELLAKLNAYELKEYKYFSLNTAMAEKARDDTAEAAAEVAKLVEGPDGIVFQHRARLSGRPLETVGEGGETMGREQRRLVLQALIAAKEAANGIIAATDEFSLRPANVLDRLPGLAEEEALDAKRMAAHAKLVEQAKINQAMFEEAKRERDEAVGFVARIPKEDLNELKQYRTPPESVRRTLVAVVTLLTGSLAVVDLKYTELLLAFQNLAKGKLMTALRLAETLRHYDATTAAEPVITGVNRTFCEDARWSHENITRASPGVAPLCLWVHCQITVWKANRRMGEIDLDSEIMELDHTAMANVEIERTRIEKKVNSVDSAVGLLTSALTAIAGLGEEAEATRKKLLLWRSQLLGMVGRADYASMDNELLTQVGPSTGMNTTADKRVTERRLATSARLAQTSQGKAALHHAHVVASSILSVMTKKKVTPIEEDDTEKLFGIVMKAYTRERDFREPIVPRHETQHYPVRSNDGDATQQSAIRALKRRRRLNKLRQRKAMRRANAGIQGLIAMRDGLDQAKQDEAALAARQIKGILDVDWGKNPWTPLDFFEVQQPFENVRNHLVKAVDYTTQAQKLKSDDLMSVQASLKFVGVPQNVTVRILSGLGRGDLVSDMIDALKGCTPPPSFVDLDALLQVIREGKSIIVDVFRGIAAPDPETMLQAAASGKQLKPEDLLIQLHDFCKCIEDAGALDASTDYVMLEKTFTRALSTQLRKESPDDAANIKKSVTEEETSSSRRKRNTDKGEMSLLGFVAGIVRVAAGRSPEIPSLHRRVEVFIQTNLVSVLAKEMEKDDDITVATRQPVVVKTLTKWKECIRACFIHFCPEEEVEDLTDEDGNVNVDDLALSLLSFLQMCRWLGWHDMWMTQGRATAVFFQTAKPEDGRKKFNEWTKLSMTEAQELAETEELELFFDQFEALVVRMAYLKRSYSDTPDNDTTGRFEHRVAKITDNLIQTTILSRHIEGEFDRDGEQGYVTPSESGADSGSDIYELEDYSDDRDEHHMVTGERKKLSKGLTALTNAADEDSEAKARALRAQLEKEAQELAANAEAESQLDDKEVRQLFRSIDADGGGSLDKLEVKTLLTRLGLEVDDESVDRVMTQMDPDGDGEVTLPEFLAWWHGGAGSELRAQMTALADAAAVRKERERREQNRAEMGGHLGEDEVRELFDEVDTDGGGTLDKDEVQMLMVKLGLVVNDWELAKVMRAMDPNGDGEVDVDEFLLWWSRAGAALKKKMTTLADETVEQRETARRAQARADAGLASRLAARKKMREAEKQLRQQMFRAWHRNALAFKTARGGLGIRVWASMNKQQRALHTAGTIAKQQGRRLMTSTGGRLTPRKPQPPRDRFCTQCGVKFALLPPDAPVAGTGKQLAHKQALGWVTERTKELLSVEQKLLDATIIRDAIVQSGTGAKEEAAMVAKAEADVAQLQAAHERETAKLAQTVEVRKRHAQTHGERRMIPNRELCPEHRPRRCKYTEANGYGAGAVCGRIFTLADAACRAGGVCCEQGH